MVGDPRVSGELPGRRYRLTFEYGAYAAEAL